MNRYAADLRLLTRSNPSFSAGYPELRRLKVSLHCWELPSIPSNDLHPATAQMLTTMLHEIWPYLETRIEVDFDNASQDTVYSARGISQLVNPDNLTWNMKAQPRGAKIECDIRGGSDRSRHVYQHIVANVVEAVMRRVMGRFILADAQNRLAQKERAYRTYNIVDEPEDTDAQGFTIRT